MQLSGQAGVRALSHLGRGKAPMAGVLILWVGPQGLWGKTVAVARLS